MQKRFHIVYDTSSVSLVESVIEHITWTVAFMLMYYNSLFMPIDGLGMKRSRFVLLLLMVACSVIGILLRYGICLSTRGGITDVLLGIGIYMFYTYLEYYKKWFICIWAIIAVFIVTLGIYALNGRMSLSKLRRSLSIAGIYAGVLVAVAMLPICYNRFFNSGILAANADIEKINDEGEKSESIYDYIELLKPIRLDETFCPLPVDEKLNILQTVCYLKENDLGMAHELKVVVEDLDDGVLGAYDDQKRVVLIDRDHLEYGCAEKVLETCYHEIYHAYERRITEVYMSASESQKNLQIFNHCREYLKEIQEYKDGSEGGYEGFIDYYIQFMEIDAREFAKQYRQELYARLDIATGFVLPVIPVEHLESNSLEEVEND